MLPSALLGSDGTTIHVGKIFMGGTEYATSCIEYIATLTINVRLLPLDGHPPECIERSPFLFAEILHNYIMVVHNYKVRHLIRMCKIPIVLDFGCTISTNMNVQSFVGQ